MESNGDIYKISYVVIGSRHPGAIVNATSKPELGAVVDLGNEKFIVEEIVDLLPARGKFHYLHVTCKPIKNE
jgi:hypothetical protein